MESGVPPELECGVWIHSGAQKLESGVTPESGVWSHSGIRTLESGGHWSLESSLRSLESGVWSHSGV